MASAARRASDPKPCPPKPSPQEWLNVKNDIERLYVVECHNLRYVAHVLQHRRNFVATLRMYKSRIKEWNFDQKTIRQADWRFMFQEYSRRKGLNPPKETVFRVCQDRHGRVTKSKTIKHIRTYMRRKQVSEDEFLSFPSDPASYSHIRCFTPPISPTLSAASASPSSQVDGYNTSNATPPSFLDISSADGRGFNSLNMHNPVVDVFRQFPRTQTASSPSNHHHQISSAHRDSLCSSRAENSQIQERAAFSGPRAKGLTTRRYSAQSPAITNAMLHGSRRMAMQTFALDKEKPWEDVELYRSVARPPSLACSEPSDTDDNFSAVDLARTLSDLDSGVYDEHDRINPAYVLRPTDITAARAQAFTPDEDQALAFRWASMYFLACILQGRMKDTLADAVRASATKLFECMLSSETRSPYAFPRPAYVPSHRSRFILSGLTLMATVLNAHGRDDMLRIFLVDTRRSIARFFRREDHPLSTPYTYVISLTNHEPIDDEAWERTLRDADTTIGHVWNEGPNSVVSHYYLAWHILKRNRYAEAIGMLHDCLHRATALFGECHILTINCLSTIARALYEQGRYDEAMSSLVDTVRRTQHALGESHPFCYKLIERVSDIHEKLGDLASAERVLREVVEGRKKSLGLHHGHTSSAAHKLAEVLRQQGKVTESTQLERDLDEDYQEQQAEFWEREERYFPDWRELHSTHPSLNIKELIALH